MSKRKPRRWFIPALCGALTGAAAWGQPVPEQPAPDDSPPKAPFEPIALAEAPQDETRQLEMCFNHKRWHYRVFGLLRLERYAGPVAAKHVERMLTDEDWHVRCFALRAAVRFGVPVADGVLARETHPAVLRLALQLGLPVPALTVSRQAGRLMRSSNVEDKLMGLEIAAASGSDAVRESAGHAVARWIRTINEPTAVLATERLARLLRLGPEDARIFQASAARVLSRTDAPAAALPLLAHAWKTWLKVRRERVEVPPAASMKPVIAAQPRPWVAELDWEAFGDILRYLDTLQGQDMELALVVDATGSMGGVLRQTQSQVDRLILIFNDLSNSMRIGFVAYRDYTDRQVTGSHALTDDVETIRKFLFGVQALGGGDHPEAVLAGLRQASGLRWKRDANHRVQKTVIVVGDAPPHQRDLKNIQELVRQQQERGFTYHAIMTREVDERLAALAGVDSPSLQSSFGMIAKLGRGRAITLDPEQQLAKTILRLSVDERVGPAFDDFYDLYVLMCL